MRIAFLCKQQYTGHDVIRDRYGRLYQLPLQLARLGHTVAGFCLSYHKHSNGLWIHPTATGHLQWTSRTLLDPTSLLHGGYPLELLRGIRSFEPDIIVGASDIPHAALACWIARKLDRPLALDLYDNFESFGQARIPGFVRMLSHAIRRASLLVCVTPQLEQFVRQQYRPTAEITVMGNGLDRSLFHPREKLAARRMLNLPQDAFLIGTAGNLHRLKGIATVYGAWPEISASCPDAQLVLAGPVERGYPPPSGPKVHFLGNLTQAQMPELFSAMDLGIVSVLDSAFGRYCFPQKAYEMLACGLTVIASDVGALADALSDTPELLFQPGDPGSLAHAALRQISRPKQTDLPISDWAELVARLEPALTRAARLA